LLRRPAERGEQRLEAVEQRRRSSAGEVRLIGIVLPAAIAAGVADALVTEM
jgi:hypothetical protein